ncbi:MAG: HAD family phosphatase [Deltaproteobacteria bacterium]|nr:HAD family phosphatase [Deltaproteobacteria bacterium]
MKGSLSGAMLITDLDGTLLRSDGSLTKQDMDALYNLGNKGVVRVIATGRSLYSFKTVAENRLPVDYVIFSTGAGVITCPDGRLIRNIHLDAGAVSSVVQVFMEFGLDFMVHQPIPENHRFVYYATGRDNPDFHRRLARYSQFCQPLDSASSNISSASQLLAVVNHDNSASVLTALRSKLTGYSVIRSTSPLDGKSTWIEVFAPGVSKSQCAAWLVDRLNIDKELVLAVGNDYNDLDLLEWAGTAFLVDNAPDMLKKRFTSVASHDHGGVAEAIHLWLSEFTRSETRTRVETNSCQ